MQRTFDLNIHAIDPLTTPRALKEELPMRPAANETVVRARETVPGEQRPGEQTPGEQRPAEPMAAEPVVRPPLPGPEPVLPGAGSEWFVRAHAAACRLPPVV